MGIKHSYRSFLENGLRNVCATRPLMTQEKPGIVDGHLLSPCSVTHL